MGHVGAGLWQGHGHPWHRLPAGRSMPDLLAYFDMRLCVRVCLYGGVDGQPLKGLPGPLGPALRFGDVLGRSTEKTG